jgi:Protein of unknown function (DUF2878)
MRLFINALGFQSAWWACIAGVGHGLEIPALVYGLVLAVLHVAFSRHRKPEIQLAATALLLGLVIDTLLQASSVIEFYGWSLKATSPFWLWLLWVLFAMTLNGSLSFLQTRPWWFSALAGAVLGPLTYYAGAQFGAASFDGADIHIAALALTWMAALPLLVYMAKQLFTCSKGQP